MAKGKQKTKQTNIKLGDEELKDIKWEDLEKEFISLSNEFHYFSTLILRINKENSELIKSDKRLAEVMNGFIYSLKDLVLRAQTIRDMHMKENNGSYVSIQTGPISEDSDVYKYIDIGNRYGMIMYSLGDLVSKFWLGVLPTLKTKNNEQYLEDLAKDINALKEKVDGK